jgi:hypothetical protein
MTKQLRFKGFLPVNAGMMTLVLNIRVSHQGLVSSGLLASFDRNISTVLIQP